MEWQAPHCHHRRGPGYSLERARVAQLKRGRPRHHRHPLVGSRLLRSQTEESSMNKVRCAVYTRKSSEEGLEQDFNSLDAQREACEAFVVSQKREGWILLPELY